MPRSSDGIGHQVDDLRHPALRLAQVPIHDVAFDFLAAAQQRHRVAHVRRLGVFPIQIARIAADRQRESIAQPLPQAIGARVEPPNDFDLFLERLGPRDDADDAARRWRRPGD